MKALVLSSSPRRNGNSAALAASVAAGLSEAGHIVDQIFVNEIISSFLQDCRQCRRPDGSCSINDGFEETFVKRFLPADGVIMATPVYWYGMSAQLKAFFDRMFCYVATSYPQSTATKLALQGKRIGLLLSSEETFPTVSAGIVHQVQEYCRYTRSLFVGIVHGHGNARGDVYRDPSDPITAAHRLGQSFFTVHASDYQIDTDRPARMWQ
jgi:multimeric flavodoxin WrbA